MQRRMNLKTIAITGAFLALSASAVPNATACTLPGASPLGVPAILPPALFAAPSESPSGQSPTSIVGLWSVTFHSGGVVVDQAFDAWHSDGTEVLNDYTDPIEGNVCLGVWTQTGPQTYQLKHPSWTFDGSGNLTGTAYILETITVGPGGNEYGGPYTISFFDLSGNPVGTFPGAIKAYRIMPD
jgi:hypothetical protein